MSLAPNQKIKEIDDLVGIVASLKDQGQKVVMCHGVFDLVHPGHIRHLKAAKEQGDILIVSLTPDEFVNKGPGRPVFHQGLRCETLASLEFVDFVFINKWWTAIETLKTVKPSIYIKGNDYSDSSKDVTGNIEKEKKAVESVGGKIIFTDEITFSSSNLLNNFFSLYTDETTEFLKGFRKRHNFEKLQEHLDKASQCKTLVLGDIIIDEYHYCEPMGKSPKANLISTRYLSEEKFAGGVLAAANHAASISSNVHLVTCLGPETGMEKFVLSRLKKNITHKIFQRQDAPTVVKRRFVEPSYLNKMFEVSFLDNLAPLGKLEDPLCDYVESIIDDYDLVLVTDFGHGLMSRKLRELVCRKAKFLALNVQTNSANMGFNLVTKYPRANYVCIDEIEARLALQDRTTDLDYLIEELAKVMDADLTTVTHGHHGCLVFSQEEGLFKVPALTTNITDTVGAGDAFLSISSPCVATQTAPELAGFIGNVAGAISVGVVGNRSSVEKTPLLKFVSTLLK